jgi:hypothetical protein
MNASPNIGPPARSQAGRQTVQDTWDVIINYSKWDKSVIVSKSVKSVKSQYCCF